MDSNKRRKKNKIDNCKYCLKQFEHYTFDTQEYCSKQCFYNSIRDKRPKHNCTTCGDEIKITKYRETRNNEYYCSRKCYNTRKKDNLKKLKRHTEYFNTLLENSTCECGVYEKYLLQIHHKDGNTLNNNQSNLEVVCANCHIRRHLKRNGKGELVYHTKSLTQLELV